jgi:hypothetical protein
MAPILISVAVVTALLGAGYTLSRAIRRRGLIQRRLFAISS